MNLIILVGISGSGKSTWTKEFLAHHPDYVVVNRDSLRLSLVKTLDGYYQRPDLYDLEQIVNHLTETIIISAKAFNKNIIVDNTNLTLKYIMPIITSHKVTDWQYKLFDLLPEIAKVRIMLRDYCAAGPVELLPMERVAYIDKQTVQYEQIKKWLLTTCPEKQLN